MNREREELIQKLLQERQEQARQQSKGLGDTIAKITSAVGIKPCGGCAKRQMYLNRLIPYKKKDTVKEDKK
jgi:hypothetical protein